ncbi:hypothetical protein AC579_1463 [Pseudocercospora musae]|uniref:Uncharacterized protein n=1 Tax=Pseudocercospora musae TaxID=113226 RepID=A0A139IMN0_9PEZI|nr:hypothetical protein AC579_1463 [Pseudocercospora musae]
MLEAKDLRFRWKACTAHSCISFLEAYPKVASAFSKTLNRPSRQAWSVDALKNHFFEAVLALAEVSLVCYINALDECNEEDARDMNLVDAKLAERQPFLGQLFKLPLTLRQEMAWKQSLKANKSKITILQNTPEKFCIWKKTTIAERIKSKIQARAAGIFLWVVLVARISNKASDR